MRIAVTSPKLKVDQTQHEWFVLPSERYLSEDDFRRSLHVISTAEFLVVDKANCTTGSFVGIALVSNVPVFQVGLKDGTFHGTYGNFTRPQWQEHIRFLDKEHTSLELSIDSALGIEDQPGEPVAGISVQGLR